ncbi:MAG: threonine/serine dehydratase [Gammaproteobacteria bacterium]|nr:threonine/serine dehydratase [Gammaproteobacteria bacterium]
MKPPQFKDIFEADRLLRTHARRTPLLESVLLNEKLDGRLLIKAEALQHTGSFKFRGAYTKISRIDPHIRPRGVVAYSSGNHAQGVAAAARLHGIPSVIVMPSDAPRIKIENTRAYGAEVVLYDRYSESRERLAENLAEQRNAILIRPYDDTDIIAGQGTVGLELATQARELAVSVDTLLCPCGGGGLIAGCALALQTESPSTEILAVEPEGFDDTARSLVAGKRLSNAEDAESFCDALVVPQPGELTFAINSRLVQGGLAVSDLQTAAAMAQAFHHFKLVVEPGGAVALAAVLSGKFAIQGKTVVVVCSGGNVDPTLYRQVLKKHS